MGEGESRNRGTADPSGALGKPANNPAIGRTTTLDDPLTTSLLAEVARRSKTIEVSAEQISEATEQDASDPDPFAEPSLDTDDSI